MKILASCQVNSLQCTQNDWRQFSSIGQLQKRESVQVNEAADIWVSLTCTLSRSANKKVAGQLAGNCLRGGVNYVGKFPTAISLIKIVHQLGIELSWDRWCGAHKQPAI